MSKNGSKEEQLKEVVRNIIIAYDIGDLTAVEGLLNEAEELVK